MAGSTRIVSRRLAQKENAVTLTYLFDLKLLYYHLHVFVSEKVGNQKMFWKLNTQMNQHLLVHGFHCHLILQ